MSDQSPSRKRALLAAGALVLMLILIAIAVSYLWPRSAKPRMIVIATTHPAKAPATRPHPAGALEPTSPEQATQIRVAVYRVRHYNLFVNPDSWAPAVRTLIEIGRPAVPELVAELERTSNDATLRAMGFVLRNIGDARAAPALARAIARTSVLSSDCGFNINDPALREFMRDHALDKSGDYVSYGRAIREIAAALERITAHTEGRPAFIDAHKDTDAERAAAKRRHEQLSQQWLTWLNAHQAELASTEEMASLSAHAHDIEPIEAQGLAAYGPLFPTGAPYHLGPVHEVALHDESNADDTQYIDFDAQRTLSLIEANLLLPPGWREQERGPSLLYHADGAGIDADAIHYLLDNKKRDFFALDANDCLTWPVENARWETLEADIAAGKPIALPDAGPFGDFDRNPQTLRTQIDRLPATHLFRTREGGAGIVQTLASDTAAHATRFRYRMIEPHPKNYIPRQPATLPTAATFAPAVELTLQMPGAGALCVADLDAGKALRTPADMTDGMKTIDWLKSQHCDVISSQFYKSTTPAGLRGHDMGLLRVSAGAFETMPANLVAAVADHQREQHEAFVIKNPKDDGLATAIYRTREGSVGLIQITSMPENPPSVTFRYKRVIPAP
jgi:hypothetical protein